MSEDVKIKKASEVLFELDRKVNVLMEMVRSLDLNIKIISNKLNGISKPTISPIIIAETETKINAFSNKNVEFVQSSDLKEESFGDLSLSRRGSRNDVVHTTKNTFKENVSEVIVPKVKKETVFTEYVDITPINPDTLIPVFQKVQSDVGKAIFLAEVSIRNIKTNKIEKTRTNGAGKWSHSLPIGKYEILITKKLPNAKDKKEIKQTIDVNSSKIPFEIEAIRFA